MSRNRSACPASFVSTASKRWSMESKRCSMPSNRRSIVSKPRSISSNLLPRNSMSGRYWSFVTHQLRWADTSKMSAHIRKRSYSRTSVRPSLLQGDDLLPRHPLPKQFLNLGLRHLLADERGDHDPIEFVGTEFFHTPDGQPEKLLPVLSLEHRRKIQSNLFQTHVRDLCRFSGTVESDPLVPVFGHGMQRRLE